MAKPLILGEVDVKAILKNAKSAHCFLLRPQPEFRNGEFGHPEELDDGHWCFQIDGNKDLEVEYKSIYDFDFTPPFYVGDEVYVREPWFKDVNRYMYKANYGRCEEFIKNGDPFNVPWESGVTMPKEAARLFLKVTDVRLIPIQDLTEEDAYKLGIAKLARLQNEAYDFNRWVIDPEAIEDIRRGVCWTEGAKQAYLWGWWNKRLKGKEYEQFMWQKNPYVWKIEFERRTQK